MCLTGPDHKVPHYLLAQAQPVITPMEHIQVGESLAFASYCDSFILSDRLVKIFLICYLKAHSSLIDICD